MTGMDKDGMLPQHPCNACGKPLNADGYHPAELYAGTYTGLCYACEKRGGYIITRYEDGAIQWSYPPHCPSWRRDRETYIAYPDCAKCNGTGRHYVSRSFARGGSYYRYCAACLDRYCNHPKRYKARRWAIKVYRTAQEMYGKEMERLGITDRDHPVAVEAARTLLARHRRLTDKISAMYNTVVEEDKYGLDRSDAG